MTRCPRLSRLVLAVALVACVTRPVVFDPNAGPTCILSPVEQHFYVQGPYFVFEEYFAFWSGGSSTDRCASNVEMMACTAAVAGGGDADEKRLAATGMAPDDIMSKAFASLDADCASRPAPQSEGARNYAAYTAGHTAPAWAFATPRRPSP